MDIQIQVNGQRAKITNRQELYSGTAAITGISFDFSKEWFGMTKTATVYVGAYDRDKAVNILIENDRVAPVQLPAEIFEKNCEVYVGVFGINAAGQRLTSSIVRQEVKKGVPVQSASDNISIDAYTRIIQLMTEAKDIAANSDEKIESNKKYVEQAKECLKQIDNITNAKMGDIANVTNAKIEDINNTASAQISNINNVTNQNIASSTDAVNAAARAQIKGITETTQGKIKDINNTALSQIEAINNTATSQIKSINNVAQENINVINGVSDGNTKEIATALDMIVDTFETKIAIEKPYYAYLMDAKIGDFNDNEITKVREYAFYEKKSLTSINLPACTRIDYSAFRNCTSLKSINVPVCTTIVNLAFNSCESLTSIDLPACTSIYYGAFMNCTKLTSVNVPVCTNIGNNSFDDCTSLTSIDLPVCTSIGDSAFGNCTSLKSIKLANTSKICTLSNSNAFNNTPIANKAGYIYVPDELVEQYKKATNWSVYASQIKPLSVYTE